MFQTEHLQEKWQPVLEHPDLDKIDDSYKRAVTTLILENQEKAMREDASFLSEAAPTNSTNNAAGGVQNWDPILISLVRRAMPNLIAYDVCGVQPMTGPTGLIFAMRAKFASQDGAEALVDEADTGFSNDDAAGDLTSSAMTGSNPKLLNDSPAGTYTSPTGMTTAQGEALGDASGNASAEMRSALKRQRLQQLHVPSKLSTRWNLLKTSKQSTVWMRRQNSPTFSPQRFLLRSTVKLFVPCM